MNSTQQETATTVPRPRLLVSVRDAAEAVVALEHGADIIDVKEPSRGALGMADIRVMEQVVAAVGGRRPVSVALGELAALPAMPSLPAGVTFGKIGLAQAPRRWREALASRFAQVRHIRPVAVAYAAMDGTEAARLSVADPGQVLRWAIDHGATALLVDTCCKDGRTVFDSQPAHDGTLRRVVDRAHEHGLIVALAGSLTAALLPRALAMGADIVAVRGAVCAGSDRQAGIDGRRVRDLADLIAAHSGRRRDRSPVRRGAD